jgi:hypothetical protein
MKRVKTPKSRRNSMRCFRSVWSDTATSAGTACALALIVTAMATGCGSNFGLEDQTTSIVVANGTWRFADDGNVATSDISTSDSGANKGDGGGDGISGESDGGGRSSPDGQLGSDTDSGDDVAPVCAPCGDDCIDGPCASAACIDGCCKKTPVSDETLCDDGNLCIDPSACLAGVCTGESKACDDGTACTLDGCDSTTGLCTATIDVDVCLIAGVCVAAGEGSGTSMCAVCNPAVANNKWSTKPGCCTVDADCPAVQICDNPICDAATGTCGSTPKLGCCTSDASCNDGDLCTTDSCNLATGACLIVPKTCPDASNCEPGACDATTGQCTTNVKVGACSIGGSCQLAGQASAVEPCLTCQPLVSATQWTPAAGAACDDGEVCTLNDACTEKGSCLGVFKSGCCKENQDCNYLATSCTAALCKLPGNVCVTDSKVGCCEGGACCDLATNTTKAKGTMCAASIVAFEYQCSGQAVQRRDQFPGCTGQSATLCSTDPAFVFPGAWTTTQTCPANTTCTVYGSGQQPTCAPKGSCAGACGGWATGNACQCAPGCIQAGNCCADYKPQCGCAAGACCDAQLGVFAAVGGSCGATTTEYQCNGAKVQKRSGSGACSGTSATCGAVNWGLWTDEQTCPSGTQCVVNGGKTSASCQPTGGSCFGKCGGQSGSCWCDEACLGLGDCCKDFANACASTVCGAAGGSSCKNACDGKSPSGCWCDAACAQLGDCCPDKSPCCG